MRILFGPTNALGDRTWIRILNQDKGTDPLLNEVGKEFLSEAKTFEFISA